MMHVEEQGDKSLSIYIENSDILNTTDVLMISHNVLNTSRYTERTLYRVSTDFKLVSDLYSWFRIQIRSFVFRSRIRNRKFKSDSLGF